MVVGSAPHASAQLAGWDPAAWRLDVHGARTSMPLRRARLAADLRASMAAPAGADAWGPLCEKKPRYNASNATLFRTVVTGAEARRAATLARSPAARSPSAPRRHSHPQPRSHAAATCVEPSRPATPLDNLLRTQSCCHCLRARCTGATG